MQFLFNARTNEKIILSKDVYSIGTFSDSDTRLNFPGSLQIILKKKDGKVVLYKGCGKFQVNKKHTLKKILEEDDEIFIGKEVFVFSLSENFDLKKSKIIYKSYLESIDGLNNKSRGTGTLVLDNTEKNSPKGVTDSRYEINSNKSTRQSEKKSNRQPGQSFNEFLVLNDKFTKQLSPILELDTLLHTVTEIAVKNINVDKALLMLYDEHSKKLSIKASKNFHQSIEELDKITQKIEREITPHLKSNSIFLNSVSVSGLEFIDSILIVKLSVNNTLFGFLCLINKIFDEFSDNDKYIIELLATQSSLAIDRINLYTKIKYETEVISELKRYLPTKAIERLIETNSNVDMKGELENCTILFVDICNFTSISESLKPIQVVAFLNEYFTIMTKIIMSYNGHVNKFIGDGLMAVFGVPIKTPNHALEATLAALEMKKHKNALRQKFSEKFIINNFNIRIGINTGPVIYGNVGSLQRMDFTVIGDNVNIASRLEANAPIGGILISRSTYENIYTKIKVTPVKKIKLKGKSEMVEVYELIDKIDEETIMHRNISEKVEYGVRENLRVAVKVPVILYKNGKEFQGLLKDISVGGVSLLSSTSGNYRIDEEIILNFKLNDNNIFNNICGIIKHIKKISPSNNNARLVMGIMFKNVIPEDLHNLTNFIEKKCINWMELPLV